MLTEERRAEIRERAERATPGPWAWNSYSGIWASNTEHELCPGHNGFYVASVNQLPEQTVGGDELHDEESQANAAFIEAARTDIPDLLDEIERLWQALTQIKENYGQVCEDFETCAHVACQSSYGAWETATQALEGSK